MSPEQLNAVLFERLKRLEDLMVAQIREKDALIAAQGEQIATLQVELKEW